MSNSFVSGAPEVALNIMRAKNAIIDRIATAVEKTCIDMTNNARNNHDGPNAHDLGRYRNRTTNLTNSIQWKPFSVTAEHITYVVYAKMQYGAYVEYGVNKPKSNERHSRPYPFMAPALAASINTFLQRLKEART